MECWQIEVYWAFDSKIIYSKGQSGAKQDWFSELYLTQATALPGIMCMWQIQAISTKSSRWHQATLVPEKHSLREAPGNVLSQPSSFESSSHGSGNRSSVPVNCNRLKWSLISTQGNSQPLSVPPQCCCWGFSCTRAGGAIRGWRREYITCLRTMTAGRTYERTCSTTTRREAGRRIRWAPDFCFQIDFRSQVRESDKWGQLSPQSYYDNLYRLSWRPVAERHTCQFVSMTTSNI